MREAQSGSFGADSHAILFVAKECCDAAMPGSLVQAMGLRSTLVPYVAPAGDDHMCSTMFAYIFLQSRSGHIQISKQDARYVCRLAFRCTSLVDVIGSVFALCS